MSNELSYYEILNVTPKATDEAVKQAYRHQVKFWHPDRNPQNRRIAELRVKALNEAYAGLKTREKRIAYNRSLRMNAENDNRLSKKSFWDFFRSSSKKTAEA